MQTGKYMQFLFWIQYIYTLVLQTKVDLSTRFISLDATYCVIQLSPLRFCKPATSQNFNRNMFKQLYPTQPTRIRGGIFTNLMHDIQSAPILAAIWIKLKMLLSCLLVSRFSREICFCQPRVRRALCRHELTIQITSFNRM